MGKIHLPNGLSMPIGDSASVDCRHDYDPDRADGVVDGGFIECGGCHERRRVPLLGIALVIHKATARCPKCRKRTGQIYYASAAGREALTRAAQL